MNFYGAKTSFFYPSFFILMLFLGSCKKDDKPGTPLPPPYTTSSAEAALQWADLILYTVKNTASNTPTYTSRSLGYLGVGMYQSVQSGSGRHLSLNKQLNDLSNLPEVKEGETYEWVISLNACQANLIKKLYPHMKDNTKAKVDSLYNLIYKAQLQKNISLAIVSRSVKFGEDVANAVYNWSLTDGGHEGYRNNFPNIEIPKGPGKWTPPANGQVNSLLPLHPFWGTNRTFITANKSLAIPEMIPYSTDPASPY
ncbi:MAG: phosphoesterase, partial [Bacteroidota bacterium]